jgi:hypothetical protein
VTSAVDDAVVDTGVEREAAMITERPAGASSWVKVDHDAMAPATGAIEGNPPWLLRCADDNGSTVRKTVRDLIRSFNKLNHPPPSPGQVELLPPRDDAYSCQSIPR